MGSSARGNRPFAPNSMSAASSPMGGKGHLVSRNAGALTLSWSASCIISHVYLTTDERAELRALINGADVSAKVATRARIVLWRAEGRLKKDTGEVFGECKQTRTDRIFSTS